MEQWEGALTLALVSALAAAGFGAGLASPAWRGAATVIVSATVAGYLVLLVVTGIYVAACPSCTSHMSYDSARPVDLAVAFLWGALFVAGVMLCTALGVAISLGLRRLGRGAR